jgi:hypothetical protein
MTRVQQKAYDWAFGLHSNIPLCCVEFYVENWDMIWNCENNPYLRAVNAAQFGYVPCPECLGRNKRVKLKICLTECGREHTEDFVPKEASNAYRSGSY